MKYLCISISVVMLVFLSLVPASMAANGTDADRFGPIVSKMVDAINAKDYAAVQADFGEVMINAFPLEARKPFFENLSSQYGRIQRLGSTKLVSPEQAVIPAKCEKGILDIRVVLDNQDKISGLYFLPGTAFEETSDANDWFDPNDPNAVARREWLEKVKEIMAELERSSEGEMRGLSDSRGDRRSDRAERMYSQVVEEFTAVKEVAQEEGALKSVELIDLILAAREKRLEEMIQKMDDDRRRERLRERDSRRREVEDRRRERSTRRSRDREGN